VVLAAIRLMLWRDGHPLSPLLLAPGLTWAVLFGSVYGLVRFVIDALQLLIRSEESPGNRPPWDGSRETMWPPPEA
jgi:hypothetical protein